MQKARRVFLIALLLVAVFSDFGNAVTKPISGLRDYNATYIGAPGTGTVGYSSGTLYRDNEDGGSYSHCNGEGCGSHPGVDIPVPSGTLAYAMLSGTVTYSQCNTGGWGGLVTIQATYPYTGETIYISYAHLRNIRVNNGPISEGTIVGETGGAPGDYCPGNSTGAHLHFQVDKNHNLSKPWFPQTPNDGIQVKGVDRPDYTYEVTTRTYNPVSLTSGFRWTFGQDGFREYWTPQNVASSGVSGGALWIDGNFDPWIWRWPNVSCGMPYPCSSQFVAEANIYRWVTLIMESYCVSNPSKVYFVTKDDPNWSEDKVVTFNASPGMQIYDVNMGSHWRWSGIIIGLRIDPAVNCSSGWDPTYFHTIQLRR